MALRSLSDEALIDFLTSARMIVGEELRREALDELFARMRAEATPEKLAYVEAVIARLKWTFDEPDDEDNGGSGVREPRRPAPSAGSAAAEAERAA